MLMYVYVFLTAQQTAHQQTSSENNSIKEFWVLSWIIWEGKHIHMTIKHQLSTL